jgi:hypothetical protein
MQYLTDVGRQVIMESHHYKSPWAALLWSMALPGFGQVYNGNYILGFVFVVAELMVNNMSKLNLSFLYTLHGDFNQSHNVVDFQWGMFYPSLWGFGMWQAFNKAKMINHHLKEKGVIPPAKKTHVTLFIRIALIITPTMIPTNNPMIPSHTAPSKTPIIFNAGEYITPTVPKYAPKTKGTTAYVGCQLNNLAHLVFIIDMSPITL